MRVRRGEMMRWTLMLPLIAGASSLGFADGPASKALRGGSATQTAAADTTATTQTSGHKHMKLGNGRIGQRLRSMHAQNSALRSQIEQILQQTENDVETLRTTAFDEIAALLTDTQKAQFAISDLARVQGGGGGPVGHRGGPGFAPMHGGGFGMESNEAGEPADQEMTEHESHVFFHDLGQLDLTADQQTQIDSLLSASQTALQALVAQAHSDIQAVLPVDQASTLNSSTPFGRHHGAAITLTPEQQSKIDAIQTQLEQDIAQNRTDTETQIKALLTADQQTQLATLETQQTTEFATMHGTLLERLTAKLTLTSDQQGQIGPILDQLASDIQARRQQAQADIEALVNSGASTDTTATATSKSGK